MARYKIEDINIGDVVDYINRKSGKPIIRGLVRDIDGNYLAVEDTPPFVYAPETFVEIIHVKDIVKVKKQNIKESKGPETTFQVKTVFGMTELAIGKKVLYQETGLTRNSGIIKEIDIENKKIKVEVIDRSGFTPKTELAQVDFSNILFAVDNKGIKESKGLLEMCFKDDFLKLMNWTTGYVVGISACVGGVCTRTKDLEKYLKKYPYIKTKGRWGGVVEDSFLVQVPTEEEALRLIRLGTDKENVAAGIEGFDQEQVVAWELPLDPIDDIRVCKEGEDGTKLGKDFYYIHKEVAKTRESLTAAVPSVPKLHKRGKQVNESADTLFVMIFGKGAWGTAPLGYATDFLPKQDIPQEARELTEEEREKVFASDPYLKKVLGNDTFEFVHIVEESNAVQGDYYAHNSDKVVRGAAKEYKFSNGTTYYFVKCKDKTVVADDGWWESSKSNRLLSGTGDWFKPREKFGLSESTNLRQADLKGLLKARYDNLVELRNKLRYEPEDELTIFEEDIMVIDSALDLLEAIDSLLETGISDEVEDAILKRVVPDVYSDKEFERVQNNIKESADSHRGMFLELIRKVKEIANQAPVNLGSSVMYVNDSLTFRPHDGEDYNSVEVAKYILKHSDVDTFGVFDAEGYIPVDGDDEYLPEDAYWFWAYYEDIEAFVDDVERRKQQNITEKYNSYDLQTRFDARSSFYGKAQVHHKENGDAFLQSYNTIVAAVIDGKPITSGRYSQTTSRHQREFFRQMGFGNLTAKELDNLDYIESWELSNLLNS